MTDPERALREATYAEFREAIRRIAKDAKQSPHSLDALAFAGSLLDAAWVAALARAEGEPSGAWGFALDCRDLYMARYSEARAKLTHAAAHELALMAVYLQGKAGARFQGGAAPDARPEGP